MNQESQYEEMDFGQTERLADYLADYVLMNARIRDMPIDSKEDPDLLARIATMGIPREGRPAKEVADEMVRDVFMQSVLTQHPRFFSFVASAVSPYSIAGAVLTDIFNMQGGGWEISPSACMIEEKLIRWMGSLAGFPQETCGGLFMSGGSIANMSAFIAAREDRLSQTDYPLGVAYVSDQTHSSAKKGLRMIGLRDDQIVVIPSDRNYRMRIELLEDAVESDISSGKKPFLVVGSLGTTNTGSIDPLEEMAAVCRKHDLWMHVDGAYGGSLLVSGAYRHLAQGIEHADTLSWDTHKWAMQVYGCSSLIARDREKLINAFAEHPEYLEDVRNDKHPDPWNMGPEMSRPHRSLKFWLTIQAMGTDALADVVDSAIRRAELVAKLVEEMDGWEVTSKPSCGTVTFRFAPEGLGPDEIDELNGRISNEIISSGFAIIVTTTIHGARVLRMCIINANTTDDDVISTMDRLGQIAKGLMQQR